MGAIFHTSQVRNSQLGTMPNGSISHILFLEFLIIAGLSWVLLTVAG